MVAFPSDLILPLNITLVKQGVEKVLTHERVSIFVSWVGDQAVDKKADASM
jgi:hypothetical protein